MPHLAIASTPLVAETGAREDPTGKWNMTLRVGHVGEGLRTVMLEITEKDGAYRGRLTSMQNRMADADEVRFEGKTLTVIYGSYGYRLEVEDDSARGTVSSPGGKQEVTAKRQQTELFAGDEPEPCQKTWTGEIEKREDGYLVVFRRDKFAFTNAGRFDEELERLRGQEVEITGFRRIDKIETQRIEPR